MLFARVNVEVYPKQGEDNLLSDTVCDKVADIVELAAWQAVENDLQEMLDIALPGQFTVKVKVD